MSGNYLLKIYSLIFVCLIFTLSGCSKEADPEDFVNIDNQYEIQLQQYLTSEGGQPAIYISSIEPHECENSYISYQTVVSDQKLLLFLHDILTEGECIAGSMLIDEEVKIDITMPELPVEINVKNIVTNTGILYTHENEFDLSLKTFDGLKISKTTINRILPKMVWGSYYSANENTVVLLEQYFQDSDIVTSEKKGDYGHFYLAQDQSVVVYEQENNDFSTFMITTNEDFVNFESKINEMKELDSGLVFHATYYDGSSINIE